MELASPGSGCNRTKPDTRVNRQRHAIAQPHTTISRSRGPRDRNPSCDGLRPTEGAAFGSSGSDVNRDRPVGAADAQPDSHAYSHDRSDADR
ncbi:MAG: hypothetical protein QOJ33_1117 [Chloroflexota bacterium]|jgi:hypothetical protein|nr:hypothetical protein [Chloroflexota bacterium]